MKKLVFVVVFLVFLSSIVFPGASSNPVLADQFGLKAVGECGFVSLSWNNVKGADTYWIYRGPGKGKEYPTPLTDFPIRSTSFTDDINIKNGQEYCYYVRSSGNYPSADMPKNLVLWGENSVTYFSCRQFLLVIEFV